ncbi:MAG TPA: retropepsin-like aspartic protease [Candidatus Elarobacter sp.]|jgi:hypothetical protein|nr:retropepsin-like aspartic protease [Candidatus Elarobacter sp.]
MIAAFVLAVALDAAPPAIRPVSAPARAARYVRLQVDVTSDGVPGRGEFVVDRTTGRFVRRFDAGPVSDRDGWDGTTIWHADATGMPRAEGNSDQRAEVLAWSRLLASPPAAPALPNAAPARAADVTVDAAGMPSAATLHVGPWTERIAFSDYRTASGFTVPGTITDASENGTWTAHVVAVDTPRTLAASVFAPPPPPDDAVLHGVATLPILPGSGYPIVAVSVDNGPPMRFVIDTGGQNAIATQAARRAGLTVVGSGTVSGVGTALAQVAFASARTVRIGSAEMRDQPFVVLDLGDGPIDGIIGYELLARFAARIDLPHGRVELARDVRELSPSGVAVRMAFDDRQPQVDGALDGIPGTMTIDTGSVGAVDVESPFVAAHDLRARLHVLSGGAVQGIGGSAHGVFARAKELRLGTLLLENPTVFLSEERSGGYADPTIAANVGDQVLRRFALVFDYRGATIHFESPAP